MLSLVYRVLMTFGPPLEVLQIDSFSFSFSFVLLLTRALTSYVRLQVSSFPGLSVFKMFVYKPNN